jgi:hypothetical protein
MNRIMRRIMVLLCCMAMVACTTLRTVVDTSQASGAPAPTLDQRLAVNDNVVVTLKDGRSIALHVTKITPEALEGTTSIFAAAMTLPADQIVRVQRSEVDNTRTLWTVVAAVVLGALIASWAASHVAFFPPGPG